MVSDVQVRSAKLDDRSLIVEFNRALAKESEGLDLDPEMLAAGVRAQLEDASRGRYFLAEAESGMLGQLAVTTEWSDWRNGFFWWLQSVYVVPEARRRGVFRTLYEHVKAEASKDPTCCGIRLYVERENEIALRTYRSLGLHDAPYRLLELDFTEREGSSGR